MKINPRAFRPDFRDLEVEQSITTKLNQEFQTPHLAPRQRSALNSSLEVHVQHLSRRTRLIVRAAIERQIMRQQIQRHTPQDTQSSDSGLGCFHAELAKTYGRIELECLAAKKECLGLSKWLANQEMESAQRRDNSWADLQRALIDNLSAPLAHSPWADEPSLSDTVILCRDGLSHARTQAQKDNDAEHQQRLAYLKRRCTEMNGALRAIRALFKRLQQVTDFNPDRAELFAAIRGPLSEEQSLQMRWSALVSIFRSNIALQPNQPKPPQQEPPQQKPLQRAS